MTIASRFGLLLLLLLVPLPAQAQSGGRVTPERLEAALAQLDTLAEQALEQTGVPGMAVAVVHEDEVVYLRGFGVREAGESDPVTQDTVFQIASMSKPIAATVLAALVSDGVVGWDDRVSDLDPAFQLFDPWVTREVTLRDLFSHRSGLPGDAGNDLEELGFGRDDILRRLRYLDSGGSFRSSYAYSNFGMTAGAVAAAAATGQSWEDLAQERLYEPLGMASTSSRYDDFVARENRAHLHIRVDGEWTPALTRDADAQSPAGGVSSSARDLAQWLRLQLGEGALEGEQVIAEAALTETHLPHILRGPHPITGRPGFYGLGWNVEYTETGQVRLGHAGAFSVGARTLVSLVPEADLGIVIITNAFPTGVPEAIADGFFDLVFVGAAQRDWLATWNNLYDQIMGMFAQAGAPYAQPPTAPAAALPAAAYAGRYANAYAGEAEVVAVGDALELRLGAQTYRLEPFHRDVFIYYPVLEMPDIPLGVTFTVGPDGRATQLVLDALSGTAQGVMRRME